MVSCAVCARPMRLSVSSLNVCGLTEMRVVPAFKSISSMARSMVSGRPASTVCSTAPGKAARAAKMISSKASRGMAVGVPPPT